MKILHVTPHLGGGVGKAHTAINGALPNGFDQTFILLEAPRDRRYADLLEAANARVIVADNLDQVARLAGSADVVQFEFWNHPRLFECLARCDFPAIRSVFWSHISGLSKPVIQPGLMQAAGRFVMTTEASWLIPSFAALREATPEKFTVINSGFGFSGAPQCTAFSAKKSSIAYLGTVDFVKMHSGFFDAIDRLTAENIHVAVWGAPAREVVERARGHASLAARRVSRPNCRASTGARRIGHLLLSVAARSLWHGGECPDRSNVVGSGAGCPEQSSGNGDRPRWRDRARRAFNR